MSPAPRARAPRWLVHIEWMDGQIEEVIGDPNVDNGLLRVQLLDDNNSESVRFMACYPLRHVRVWWCHFAGEDSVQVNAAPRRSRQPAAEQ